MDEAIMSILKMAPKEILQEYLDGSISPQLISEQHKVDDFNNEVGNKTGYDCPICKNKGIVAYLRSDMMCTKECECMARRRSLRRIEESGLKPVIENYRFDNYETTKPWQREVKDMAIDYLERGNGWFLIAGTPGTGKTHICTAICGKLLERNKDVRYMMWRDDVPALKASINDRSIYEKRMSDLKSTDVLYIDDFWKGTVTDADINLTYELLNSRYNDRSKITIISGEKDINDILEIDEAIGSRIYERSKEFYFVTPKENYRLQ